LSEFSSLVNKHFSLHAEFQVNKFENMHVNICLEVLIPVLKFLNKKVVMQQVKNGDTVKVHYHGKLNDGSTFDSSAGRQPLEFEVGSGAVIPGFDEGVKGMSVGEKKTISIPADEAYGSVEDDRIFEFPIDRFPPDIKPEPGMTLDMSNGQGEHVPVVISEIRDDIVVLDANHPLAGKDLTFDIEVMEIKSKSPLIILP
jgi:peptidylprolyl isomerase